MNKIISMNHSHYGDRDMVTIPLTQMERLDAKRKVAQSLQNQTAWEHIVEKGWIMEGEVFVALVDFANGDPEHILNAQMEVNWQIEAEAQAADAADWQATRESDYPR